jgi:hypothetical protein
VRPAGASSSGCSQIRSGLTTPGKTNYARRIGLLVQDIDRETAVPVQLSLAAFGQLTSMRARHRINEQAPVLNAGFVALLVDQGHISLCSKGGSNPFRPLVQIIPAGG